MVNDESPQDSRSMCVCEEVQVFFNDSSGCCWQQRKARRGADHAFVTTSRPARLKSHRHACIVPYRPVLAQLAPAIQPLESCCAASWTGSSHRGPTRHVGCGMRGGDLLLRLIAHGTISDPNEGLNDTINAAGFESLKALSLGPGVLEHRNAFWGSVCATLHRLSPRTYASRRQLLV